MIIFRQPPLLSTWRETRGKRRHQVQQKVRESLHCVENVKVDNALHNIADCDYDDQINLFNFEI